MLVPIIQYSSMFVLTPKIIDYYKNSDMHTESIQFVQHDKGKLQPEIKTSNHF